MKPRRQRTRAGNTLVELLVALPLAGLIGTIAVAQFLDLNTLARRLNASSEISRELRHSGEILASELRPLSAPDLIAWSDTAIEFHAMVGSGIVCVVPASNTIDLLPLNGDDALRTVWFATPQTGDNLWTIPADSMPMPQAQGWEMSSLQSTATSAASPCKTLPIFTSGSSTALAPQRLTLSSGLTHKPQSGTLARITRHVRYSLYKSSDGLWYLGRKSLDLTGWTTVQPVAGPLLSASNIGLRIVVRDSASNAIPFGNTRTPRTVALTLHAASRWMRTASQPGVADSLNVTITLRGATP